MNKSDIIQKLAKYTLTKNEAKKIVNFIFDTITTALLSGEKVHIQNLGTFIVRTYKAKKMYHPKKKKFLLVNPKRKIKFVVSKKLLLKLNKNY